MLVNSGKFSGMTVPAAIEAMTATAEKEGFGVSRTNFKIRDWGVSRQRAWGTPIPFVHCPDDGIVPVPEDQLPVELPVDLDFNTQGSPLAEDTEVCKHHVPPVRRSGEARYRHDGHLRGFIVVLLPVLRSSQ